MPKNKVNNNIKLKSGGGILNGVDGLEADTFVIPTTQTMPAYEDLVAGDLLKTINDGGTYKLKKITGIQANTGTFTSGSNIAVMAKGIQISSNKIVVCYMLGYLLYLRTFTISGSTITDDNNQVSVGLGTDVDQGTFRYEIKKVADNKFIVVYDAAHTNIYGRVFSVSGTTITPGTETIIESTAASRAKTTTIEEIETNKFLVASTILTSDSTSYVKARIIYTSSSDNSITTGNVINAYSDYSYHFFFRLKLIKVNTDTFVLCGNRSTGSAYYFSAMVINISGVNLTGGGYSDQLLTDSDLIYDCYLYDTNKVFAILNYGGSNNYKKVIFLTRTSNTITNTAFNTTIECGIANKSFTIKKLGSFYYANTFTKTTKFLADIAFGTKTIKEYTTSDNQGLLVNYDNKAISFNGYTYSSVYTNYLFLYLLDHDEFVTSANAAYTAGDSVPLTDRFTGFSGLANGLDYYINADASGLTVDSTYQKIGKAITDTTILKG